MTSFGETVSSLVDAYTKCLTLLKVSRRAEDPTKLRKANAGSDSASGLQRSLRQSRSKINRTYTSKLSDGGASFEKGDAAARGSLRRIVRMLMATLTKIQASFTGRERNGGLSKGAAVDYASLVSLCESSRSDALKTMTDLSARLSTSSASTVSRGSRRSRTSRKLHHSERRPHRRDSQVSHHKRLSRVSTSSNSTKLGEVRRRRHDGQPGTSNSHAAYPRRSLNSRMPELASGQDDRKQKSWWNVFR